MFKSKVRSIVVPQSEHGRLSGTLAAMWGNDNFDKPAVDFTSFVRGVALHDWHYGVIDNLPISEASENDWLKTTRRGVEYWFDDPITDIVVKLHIKRLVSGQNTPERKGLINRIELRISERLPQTHFSREQFEWADKITRFCDHLAFDFSFEEPIEHTVSVYSKTTTNKKTPLTYKIKPGGKIEVAPWPFSVDTFSGIIIGYQQADYPETLTPEVVRFQVYRRT